MEQIDAEVSSITDSENNHYLFIAATGTGGYGMRGHVVKLSTAGTILWQRLEINGITNPSSGGVILNEASSSMMTMFLLSVSG